MKQTCTESPGRELYSGATNVANPSAMQILQALQLEPLELQNIIIHIIIKQNIIKETTKIKYFSTLLKSFESCLFLPFFVDVRVAR